MPTIRRSIYIGLGGTGIRAIAHTKKQYEDVFGVGNIPSQIEFLALDFDTSSVWDKSLPTSVEEDIIHCLFPSDIRGFFTMWHSLGKFNWFSPINEHLLPGPGQSFGQCRAVGRLLTELVLDQISRRIGLAMNRVMIMGDIPQGYTLSQDNGVDVHIAMSLAGGTGAGSFINIAQLVRERYGHHVCIYGYGVMYGVFEAMNQTRRVGHLRVNTYASVLDLDYMQTASPTNPIALEVAGQTKVLECPLFDYFYLIDNKTEDGSLIGHSDDLCGSLGSGLYLHGCEVGDEVQTFLNNVDWRQGNYNWENKLGWVHRLGVCQVVYKGERLAQIYALRAKIELIRQMQSPTADVSRMAWDWTENKIFGESGLWGMVKHIVFFKHMGDVDLSIRDDLEVASAKLKEYLDVSRTYRWELQYRMDAIMSEFQVGLREFLLTIDGVEDARLFLLELMRNCGDCERAAEVHSSLREQEQHFDRAYESYKHWRERGLSILFHRDTLQELLGNLSKEAKKLLQYKGLAALYASLLETLTCNLETLLSSIEEMDCSINKIKDGCYEALSALQNPRKSSMMFFEYDLSAEERLNLTLGQNEVLLTSFTAKLKKPLAEMSKDEIAVALESFASALPRCEEYKSRLIEDVIENLSEADYNKLKQEVARKVSPLLEFKSLPFGCPSPCDRMQMTYFVSIYKADIYKRSRMENDHHFMFGNFNVNFIPSDTPNMKQRIVFYRQDAAVIPYLVDALDESVQYEYETILSQVSAGNAKFHPHFDLQIFQEMRKRDFKLTPETTREAMFYWVAGQFFGWTEVVEKARNMEKDQNGATLKEIEKVEVKYAKYIRFDKTKYRYWNEKGQSRGQSEKWTDFLTANRKRAFEFFKFDVLPLLRDEYKSLILNELNLRGTGYYKTVIDKLKADGKQDYIDKVMCSNKSSVTYYSTDGKTVEAEFVDQEWAYIESEFLDALLLLR